MSDLYTEKIVLKSFNITDGTFYCDFPGHTHAANCFELHYIKDGKGTLITSEKTYKLRKNTVYVTGPNVYHMQKTDFEVPMREYCIFFELDDMTQDMFLNIFLSQGFWIGKSSKIIKKLFEDIYALHLQNTAFHLRQAALLIYLLMLELAAMYQPQILKLQNKSNIGVTNDIVTIEDFFLFNISNLSLDALSCALRLSKRQTQRLLLKNYGKNFQQKKSEAQLEHAKMLLESGGIPLSQISDECGFYSSSAFCNFFKKHMGLTPTEYRRCLQKNSGIKRSDSAMYRFNNAYVCFQT